jgi:hypothetical protein
MTDPRDELVERVARALCTDDGNPCGCTTACKIGLHYADTAIAVALEEAAKLAEAKADEWATVWRNGLKCDSHMEGMSDGADEIAAAIRAMIKES